MKFLIVDDDPACREFLMAVLLPYGQCDLAFDGAEALDAFRLAMDDGWTYDLVCLDIMMPGIDGHQALEGIRQMETARGIRGSDRVKVIMTTALRDSRHCIRSFREGCESYCTKPIRQDVFLGHVRNLLGELPMPTEKENLGNKGLRDSEEPLAGKSRQSPDPQIPAQQSPAMRFLVVDDDGICRELVRAILEPHGQCTFAYDGREAVDAVRLALEDNNPFDMIALDIMMPGTSGHEALTQIRELESQQGIRGSDGVKVIMTTALRDSKHCIQSFREGCECYVTKPIDADELLGKMRDLGLLEREGATSAP